MICPNCKTEYEGNFCPNGCNAPKVCPKCGVQYVGNFCPNGCNSNSPQKQKKNNTALIIVLVIVAVFVVCVIAGAAAMVGIISKNVENSDFGDFSYNYEDDDDSVTTSSYIDSTSEEVESREDYIQSCWYYDYKELARNPEHYKGERIMIKVEISQIMESGFFSNGGYRGYEDYELDFEDTDSTYYQQEWYIDYEIGENEPRILENDVIYVYGEYAGTTEVQRALTNTTDYVPTIRVAYYDFANEE